MSRQLRSSVKPSVGSSQEKRSRLRHRRIGLELELPIEKFARTAYIKNRDGHDGCGGNCPTQRRVPDDDSSNRAFGDRVRLYPKCGLVLTQDLERVWAYQCHEHETRDPYRYHYEVSATQPSFRHYSYVP